MVAPESVRVMRLALAIRPTIGATMVGLGIEQADNGDSAQGRAPVQVTFTPALPCHRTACGMRPIDRGRIVPNPGSSRHGQRTEFRSLGSPLRSNSAARPAR
jgi:hypothetical protein